MLENIYIIASAVIVGLITRYITERLKEDFNFNAYVYICVLCVTCLLIAVPVNILHDIIVYVATL